MTPKKNAGHPATFSADIIYTIAKHLPDGAPTVLDPMAGIGKVHRLRALGAGHTVGIELEDRWAARHADTIHGDARDCVGVLADQGHAPIFDVMATSPAYGNRMADQYIGPADRDTHTYANGLGRECSPGSGAALQWGPGYRELHGDIWRTVLPLIRHRAIVNVKNHIRDRQLQRVAEWHVDTLVGLGFQLVAIDQVDTKGLAHGQNWLERTAREFVFVLDRREPLITDVAT